MTRRVTHLICVLGLAIATIGLASAPASAAALDFTVVDHRYCYVLAGGSNCHTPAILTTTCNWWYSTSAAIYIWNGSTWALVAWDHPGLPTSTCGGPPADGCTGGPIPPVHRYQRYRVEVSRSGCPPADQAGFVGVHNDLDAVAQIQFGQHPADVGLHRRLGDVQAGGNLGIAQALSDDERGFADPGAVRHPERGMSPWHGLGVFAAETAVLLLAAWYLLRHRDV